MGRMANRYGRFTTPHPITHNPLKSKWDNRDIFAFVYAESDQFISSHNPHLPELMAWDCQKLTQKCRKIRITICNLTSIQKRKNDYETVPTRFNHAP